MKDANKNVYENVTELHQCRTKRFVKFVSIL